MTDTERIQSLLARMAACEARKAEAEAEIDEVKRDLASILLPRSAANPAKDRAPNRAESKRSHNKPPKAAHTPVAKGTKGRKVIEIIDRLGGKARAGKVAEHLGGGPQKKTVKRVRTYIYHLSREETGYLASGDEPGVWQLTPKAYEALGKAPPTATGGASTSSVTDP